ncbi:Rieske 2Fe-2S domain-containing protein [Xanthobacter variabilis]|uniref:Rieske 2Fe-2S domain-containing protein n=1 Tax=Xanthobacter variabilis TaxID=3119932 RepID=UPI003726431A
MSFKPVCTLDDLWEGDMQVFEVGAQEVLVVNAEGGVIRAFDPICPHQEQALIEGTLEGCVLTCPAHLWQFDVVSGEGVNPTGCRLNAYPVRVEGADILVDLPD